MTNGNATKDDIKKLRNDMKKGFKSLENKTIKKLNIVINGFDRICLNHEKRIIKVEQNLGIPLDVN